MRQGYPLLPLLFNIVLDILARTIKQEKETKFTQTGKEEMKQSLFSDDMIIDTENLKESTKSTRTGNFSKVIGYEINIQRSIVFLCTTTNEHGDTGIKKCSYHFKWLQKIEIGINLTKYGQRLHVKNYKKLMKEINKCLKERCTTFSLEDSTQ